MKKILLLLVFLAVCLIACNKKNKEDGKSVVLAEQVAQGEKLFAERTCAGCHTLDNNDVGPSIKDIVKTYKEQDKDIIKFLKGEIEHPIVDTDTSQVAVMKNNIEEFIKNLSDEELNAISVYMLEAGK